MNNQITTTILLFASTHLMMLTSCSTTPSKYINATNTNVEELTADADVNTEDVYVTRSRNNALPFESMPQEWLVHQGYRDQSVQLGFIVVPLSRGKIMKSLPREFRIYRISASNESVNIDARNIVYSNEFWRKNIREIVGEDMVLSVLVTNSTNIIIAINQTDGLGLESLVALLGSSSPETVVLYLSTSMK